ncbi:MAG: hypothetical protein AAF632_24940 [Bacteroidota bacterium]
MNTITKYTKSALLVTLITVGIASNVFAKQYSVSTKELVSFEAEAQTEQVNLSWSLSDSIEGQTYVQRAGMDMQFETISPAQNNEDGQFEDQQPQSGISFYRLVTYLEDGTVIYHKTITVTK